MWIPHGVLHEGAEATVTAGSWLGRPAVLKTRRARGYRHPDLDRRLTRQRLTSEARILGRLHELGFPAPALIDLDQGEAWILMSRIEGRPLYESLKDGSSGIGSLEHLGRIIRCLLEAGFSHGDLTTHNVIVSHDWQVHLIDFGLA